MNSFRVESVRIGTTPEKAFRYIADPKNLPEWTHAFKEVLAGKAIMATPAGSVTVDLEVKASASEGTVDWHMTLPDGGRGAAFSRLVPENDGHCVYTFVLLAPPLPLEKLEGTLDQQALILKDELAKLGRILDQR